MTISESILLEPIETKFRFAKQDPNDLRLGDTMQFSEKQLSFLDLSGFCDEKETSLKNAVTLVGYPDDEGISLNGGRPGAKLGPSRIRHFLMRMTPPAHIQDCNKSALIDLGNIAVTAADDLRRRHEAARKVASTIHERGARLLSIGGGHDYGFPDAAAFCSSVHSQGLKPLVINFDAHLDVRPLDRGITSGTPFYRLLEEFPQIDFHEIGLQTQCNSKTHLEWLKSRGGHFSFEEDRQRQGETLLQALQRQMAGSAAKRPKTFLSIDIDAFSSSVAPGASQSWPTGFQAPDFFNCFSWCLKNLDVRGVGVYEVSPPLDIDDRTARLAALIAHRFVFQY